LRLIISVGMTDRNFFTRGRINESVDKILKNCMVCSYWSMGVPGSIINKHIRNSSNEMEDNISLIESINHCVILVFFTNSRS